MKNWVRTLLVLFRTTMLDFLQLVKEYSDFDDCPTFAKVNNELVDHT